jgi:uncharacterized membrane protein
VDAYLLDWANLLLRWLHVITAIAWVGSSFYFVWLDNHLVRPKSPDLLEKGVDGALWAVHGGGFYNPQKYMVAPKKIHTELHWFYWESYSTWLSGFALFTVLYLWNAGSYLVDRSVHAWSPAAAAAAALAFLVVFWFVYDGICRAFGAGPAADRKVGAAVFAFVVLASWLACQLFAGRAAYLLVGAMMATAMSANVFFWIIPGQRKVVAAMAGRTPIDPLHGKRGKQRSTHNTYFTLPVLFAMLSNHHGQLHGHRWNWVILVLVMLSGALIRQFFVERHRTHMAGRPEPWQWAAAGVAPLLVVIVWLAPWSSMGAPRAELAPVTFAEVRGVIGQRCVPCHNEQLAQKGLALDSAQAIVQHAPAIHQQVVLQRTMPMNNATRMADAERALIARWFAAGAAAK